MHRLRLLSGLAAVALVAGTATATGATGAATWSKGNHGVKTRVAPALPSGPGRIRYAINRPLCATHAKPGYATCFAMRRVTVPKGTPGARPYVTPHAVGPGPAGGYTPHDLAVAYNFNPAVARSGQTVGIVDWYDDPKIASNLATFDHNYGLHAETAKSFRKVNQNGKASPLPSSSKGKDTAPEIALDVEAVRGVCNTCKIRLIEATDSSDKNLSIAENTAVRLGATEVTNSWGGKEGGEAHSTLNAFNQPGVVITASTGDDGWFAWDVGNNGKGTSSNATEFPASDPRVVSVGGTSLDFNGSVFSQTVWNENGPDDETGIENGEAEGAGGGGCSTTFAAAPWQSSFPGYSDAGCNGARLSADVSAIADPETGFDIYDNWGSGDHGWLTIGGTSLASPVVAAMWALAGGSGGAAYPAKSLYENAGNDPALVDDVTEGGNGFCGGDTTFNCGTFVFDEFGGTTDNPNALGGGDIDCSFPRNNSDLSSAPPASSECNATTGFDGPTGVGTPNSPSLLASTSPSASIKRPKTLRLHKSATFVGHAAERLPGAHITGYVFVWGDGKDTSSSTPTAAHAYKKNGTYPVAFVVVDSAGQESVAYTSVTVGKPLHLNLFGPSTLKHGHKGTFRAEGSDPNTGGVIKKVTWHWGDGHSSKGTKAKHAWHQAGTYTITITLSDSTGVTTRFTAKQKVT